MALSYQKDIKPMFTATDQDHMLNQQGMFDLWNYDDVKSNADAIYQAVKSGRMPPPGTEPRWDTAKVQKFKQWMDEGYPP
jgi:hypothetical protein